MQPSRRDLSCGNGKLAAALLVTSLLASPACSFLTVEGPPSGYEQVMPSVRCTTRRAAPYYDALLAGIAGFVTVLVAAANDGGEAVMLPGLLTVDFAVNAYIGFSRTSACRRAHAELFARAAGRLPPGAPPPRTSPAGLDDWGEPVPATQPAPATATSPELRYGREGELCADAVPGVPNTGRCERPLLCRGTVCVRPDVPRAPDTSTDDW